MPSRADFEAAADKFAAAAQQVGGLTTAAEQAGVATILRGGTLGRLIPERIAAAAQTAVACRVRIEDAEATCRERAAIIAAYESELAAYDVAWGGYVQASWNWSAQYSAWYISEGKVPHPGPHPTAPIKPTAPPDWADVRRV